jgi:RNA polymerase sigma-70 factor (ECF subfamily)
MGDPSDQALIDAINRGEVRAFDTLYYRYRDWVVRLAARFTGNQDDALDVLQETFAYVFRKFPGFVLTASMTTFLYPVVKNLSIAARRKRTRMASTDAVEAPDPPAPVNSDPTQQRSELAAAMASLPETQREVLLMRFVDGMSLQEIAGALSIPEGTVKSRIHNAINMLRSDERAARHFSPER